MPDPSAAATPAARCGPVAELRQSLAADGKALVGEGRTWDGDRIQIWSRAAGASWSLVRRERLGTACILSFGWDWRGATRSAPAE